MNRFDAIVVGAGPTGLACAIEAQRAGFKTMAIDKGCLVNSIYHYPNNMVFFTTPELLEIGDVPFTSALAKPPRLEAIEYYLKLPDDLPVVLMTAFHFDKDHVIKRSKLAGLATGVVIGARPSCSA